MKKVILLLVIMIGFVATNTQAQRYSINKLHYDSHQYFPEPWDAYNPVMSGIASLLVPGLGQVTCGETLRGLAFFGGYMGSMYTMGFGIILSATNYESDSSGKYIKPSRPIFGPMLLCIGVAGMIGVPIWSIIDAVNVAKVNNMYIRDLRKRSQLSIELSPYIDQLSINNQLSTPVGMTMRVKF